MRMTKKAQKIIQTPQNLRIEIRPRHFESAAAFLCFELSRNRFGYQKVTVSGPFVKELKVAVAFLK